MKKKLLIIEAHSDDSSLGISGYLWKKKHEFDYHFLLLACSDIQMVHCGFVKRDQRLQEYQNYVSYFNGIWHRGEDSNLPLDADAHLDLQPKKKIVGEVEKVITKVRTGPNYFSRAVFPSRSCGCL